MTLEDEIKELKRRVEELERRPVYVPVPYICPYPAYHPYVYPSFPAITYGTTTNTTRRQIP